MKITISDDEGLIIDVIEDIEQYNLDKSIARSSLIDQIKESIELFKD